MTDVRTLTDIPVERRRIVIRGVVQGVGFRPFVARLAAELRLTGHCGNDAVSVFVEAEGPADALDLLCARIRVDAPPMAQVMDLSVETTPLVGEPDFRIVPSRALAGARTLVAPDLATCPDCLHEMTTPEDRRHRHPFITCTNCGPRFTIITDLPYDRPATTMRTFEMCGRCREEYADPTDRRYHAQPICCHDCGPRLWAEERGARLTGDTEEALRRAQQVLRSGGIVAVKGVGGFHLACDAASPQAVRELRARKRRPDKPFAVMARDTTVAAEIAHLSSADLAALNQPARPIVLLRTRVGTCVAGEVAPGLDEIGVLLPYSGMHHLLLGPTPDGDQVSPTVLVMTSGNLTDEPLCYRNEDARDRLAGIADLFLMHDRKIAVPCDDSVLTTWRGNTQPIRRSRGVAPLPMALPGPGPVTLAVGAEVKNTFCLTRDDLAFCSGHLGDMGSLESQDALDGAVHQLTTLHAATPELVVADDHPGYATRGWAERYAGRRGVPLLTVQHHHAHVASLLAENGRLGTPVLGVAFDGTGHGCDRSIWGGEFLHVGTDVTRAERVGHLQTFQIAGGDRAVRNPFRVALALLHALGIDDVERLDLTTACPLDEQAVVRAQLATGTGCVATSSIGRLFDGVASLLGLRHRITYEAQAAIELESLARSAGRAADLTMDVADGQLRLDRLVRGIVDGVTARRPAAELALGFHHALARAGSDLAIRLAAQCGVDTVGLTGGVFANKLLLEAMTRQVEGAGLAVLTHRHVPSNDGGLSLGQAVIGRARAADRPPAQEEP